MDRLNDVWGLPYEFKGVKIYPIKMKDINTFYSSIQCLLYEKNKLKDVRIIKMTYLDFLFALMISESAVYDMLNSILTLIFREQKFNFVYEDGGRIVLDIDGIRVNGSEFEEIRRIVLSQNLIKDSEQYYDPEIEQALQEAEEFIAQKEEMATLEEQIVAYHCVTGIDYEKIREYTIFQFNKGMQRMSIIKNFDTYSAAFAQNGMADQIQHWLVHVEEKGKYSNAMMSKEQFDEITSDNGIFSKK